MVQAAFTGRSATHCHHHRLRRDPGCSSFGPKSSGAGGRTQDGDVGTSFTAAVVMHLRLFTSDIGGAAFGFIWRECCCEWLLCSCHEREQRLQSRSEFQQAHTTAPAASAHSSLEACALRCAAPLALSELATLHTSHRRRAREDYRCLGRVGVLASLNAPRGAGGPQATLPFSSTISFPLYICVNIL